MYKPELNPHAPMFLFYSLRYYLAHWWLLTLTGQNLAQLPSSFLAHIICPRQSIEPFKKCLRKRFRVGLWTKPSALEGGTALLTVKFTLVNWATFGPFKDTYKHTCIATGYHCAIIRSTDGGKYRRWDFLLLFQFLFCLKSTGRNISMLLLQSVWGGGFCTV